MWVNNEVICTLDHSYEAIREETRKGPNLFKLLEELLQGNSEI